MSTEDRMRMLMTGYRREIAPTASDRVRVWTRLDTDDPEMVRDTTQPRVVVIAVLVALAAAIVLLVMQVAGDRTALRRGDDASQSVHDAMPKTDAPAVRRDPPAAVLPPTPTTATAPAVAVPQKSSPRVQRPTAPTHGAATEDPLHAELRVIEAARAALERGDHDAVLAHASEHRRRFPDGALALEARSLRALALCEAGRWTQGRGEARTLLSEAPTSLYRDRLRDRCELQ